MRQKKKCDGLEKFSPRRREAHEVEGREGTLAELSEHHRSAHFIALNRKTAAAHGIADGDAIELSGANEYTARGLARVSECVHPEVAAVASCFGHWSQPTGAGGINFNSFVPLDVQGMEMLSGDFDQCALVTIRKVERNRRPIFKPVRE